MHNDIGLRRLLGSESYDHQDKKYEACSLATFRIQSMGSFRLVIEKGRAQIPKSNAGRRRIDLIILSKILVVQQLFNLSDEETEF